MLFLKEEYAKLTESLQTMNTFLGYNKNINKQGRFQTDGERGAEPKRETEKTNRKRETNIGRRYHETE